MSRAGRLIGYGFMALAALLAVLMRQAAVATIGPFPAVAVALFAAMVGVMLVLTDLMVRGLYAQVDAARNSAPDEEKIGDEHD